MSFNTIIDWNSCSAAQQQQLLMRPAISASESISKTVAGILANVKENGDAALREYSAKFDKTTVTALKVSDEEIAAAGARLSGELKQAMAVAVNNIETFHNAQRLQVVDVETQPGVRCQQLTRPIASVGLYIPGGSAPLFSTVLMLATPARIAGCQEVVLCSPPPIADEILYAAQLCGVRNIFNVGGAQAIAAMAFGTESVAKVANLWPWQRLRHRGQAPGQPAPRRRGYRYACRPVGGSGDCRRRRNARFRRLRFTLPGGTWPGFPGYPADPDADMGSRVAAAVERQLAALPRAETAREALSASRIIVARDLAQCVEISNQYGPEHLIIQTRNAPVNWLTALPALARYSSATGRQNRQVITPPAPTTCCRPTATLPPVPASVWRISKSA